ncbi:MAG: DUF6323 family protein [Bacillota bacterium]|nr:DUF6323 family protein [Bacillota bacterium]
MENNLNLIPSFLVNKLAVTEIIKCNEITCRYGLILSKKEAQELVKTRETALCSNGRIEFSGGVINKLIIEFCDSPYISQDTYTETLNELIETFYYFKNETLDEISDDELISLMKKYFDKNCEGSIELLENRELETLAHNIRYGINEEDSDEDIPEYFNWEDYDE